MISVELSKFNHCNSTSGVVSPYLRIPVVVVISVAIVVSNIINLFVLRLCHQIPRATRLLLINMSVSDLLVGVIACLPAIYSAFFAVWPYGDIFCQISGLTHGTSVTISIWSISMVGVDRCIAVCKPYKYKHWLTVQRYYIIIILMWIASIVTFVAPILVSPSFVYYRYGKDTFMCSLYWESPIYCLVTAAYIPVLSGIVVGTTTIKISKQLKINKKGVGLSKKSKKEKRQNGKTLKILFATSVAYFIYWTPYTVFTMASFIFNYKFPSYLNFVILWLANSNSSINVFIYSYNNKSFRDTLKNKLTRCPFIRWKIMATPEIGESESLEPISIRNIETSHCIEHEQLTNEHHEKHDKLTEEEMEKVDIQTIC